MEKQNSGLILNVTLDKNHGLSEEQLNGIESIIESHRNKIGNAWDKHFGS
jgi:hypothetical protein